MDPFLLYSLRIGREIIIAKNGSPNLLFTGTYKHALEPLPLVEGQKKRGKFGLL